MLNQQTLIGCGYLPALSLVVALAVQPSDIEAGNLTITKGYSNYIQKILVENGNLHIPQSLIITKKRLNNLRLAIENWDHEYKVKPTIEAINAANEWLKNFSLDLQNSRMDWVPPHITSDQDGNIAFEWWNNNKTFSVYVSVNSAWYVKAWGDNIVSEMDDGDATSLKSRIDLWSWFQSVR